jgi:hypothetical protein
MARHEVCPSPACLCYGLRAGSAEAEAEVTAERWRLRPSGAARRTMTGEATLDALERCAWLDLTGAAGDLLTVVIEHESTL